MQHMHCAEQDLSTWNTLRLLAEIQGREMAQGTLQVTTHLKGESEKTESWQEPAGSAVKVAFILPPESKNLSLDSKKSLRTL